MPDAKYSVQIDTKGNPVGATVVTESLDKTAVAAKKLGTESKETASLADELGRKGSNAKDVYEGLTQTLNGGTGAIFGVAKAWRNLSAAFAANPFGAIVAVVAALGPVLYGLAQSFAGTGEAANSAAPKVDAFAEALRKAGEARSAALVQQLKAMKDEAKGAADELERLFAIQKKFADLGKDADLATLNNTPGLSATDREVRRQEIEERAIARQRKLDRQKSEQEEGETRDDLGRQTAKRAEIEAERDQFAGSAQAARDRHAGLPREIRELEKQRDQLRERIRSAGPEGPDLADVQRGATIDQTIARLQREFEEDKTPGAAQQQRADELKKEIDSLTNSIAEANSKLRGIVEREPSGAIARGLEDTAREEKNKKAIKDALDADADAKRGITSGGARRALDILTPAPSGRGSVSTITGGEFRLQGSNGEEIGNKIAERVAERIRQGEEAIARAVAASLQRHAAEIQRLEHIIQNGERR